MSYLIKDKVNSSQLLPTIKAINSNTKTKTELGVA